MHGVVNSWLVVGGELTCCSFCWKEQSVRPWVHKDPDVLMGKLMCSHTNWIVQMISSWWMEWAPFWKPIHTITLTLVCCLVYLIETHTPKRCDSPTEPRSPGPCAPQPLAHPYQATPVALLMQFCTYRPWVNDVIGLIITKCSTFLHVWWNMVSVKRHTVWLHNHAHIVQK